MINLSTTMCVVDMQQWLDFDERSDSVLVLSGLQNQSGLLSVQTVRAEMQEMQQEPHL